MQVDNAEKNSPIVGVAEERFNNHAGSKKSPYPAIVRQYSTTIAPGAAHEQSLTASCSFLFTFLEQGFVSTATHTWSLGLDVIL